MEEGVLIRTDGLSKVYQDVRALDALSLEIRRGRGVRPAGAERLGEDDHDPAAAGPA